MNEQRRRAEFATIRISLGHLGGKTALVALSGQLDTYCYAQTKNFIFNNIPSDDVAIVLDLSGLEFSDSSGIKVIMRLIDHYAKDHVGIYGINKTLMKILEISALADSVVFIDKRVEFDSWAPIPEDQAA